MIKLAHVYTYPTQLASLYALLRHDGVFVVVNQCLLHIITNLQKSGCACSVSVLAAAIAVGKFWKAKRQRGKRIWTGHIALKLSIVTHVYMHKQRLRILIYF